MKCTNNDLYKQWSVQTHGVNFSYHRIPSICYEEVTAEDIQVFNAREIAVRANAIGVRSSGYNSPLDLGGGKKSRIRGNKSN